VGGGLIQALGAKAMRDFNILIGRNVIRWVGIEMALSEGSESVPVIWQHPSIPYAQFDPLDAFLDDGSAFRFCSQMDDGSDWFGVYSPSHVEKYLSVKPYEAGSIFRTREVAELPVGSITGVETKTDDSANVLELFLVIGGSKIRIVSGEVYETNDGSFKIGFIDESLLVQVSNGA